MKIMKMLGVLIGLSMTVGCAGQFKELPMQMYDPVKKEIAPTFASATTVGDSTDRSVTYDQIGVKDVDGEGNEIVRAISTERTVGGTTAGRTIEGATTGLVPALISGVAQVEATEEASKQCRNGNCSGGGGGITQIAIDNIMDNKINTNSTTSVGCTTCVLPTN